MASVSVVTILQSGSLDPGKTAHHSWNNAPYGKVFVLEVILLDALGSFQAGYNHTYQAQITKQWRKFITKEKPGSVGVTVDTELEIH